MADATSYEKFFLEADSDGSGCLTLGELSTMLRKKGYKDSDAKIRKMFNAVDTSGDNKISLEEYKIAMGLMPAKDHKAATMRSVFRSFDINGDGTIDRKELDEVFRSMGKSLSPDEINRIISMADKDRNGSLNYEEFIEQVFGK
jgi:Ca2+-binding EF-hand superfamily protein